MNQPDEQAIQTHTLKTSTGEQYEFTEMPSNDSGNTFRSNLSLAEIETLHGLLSAHQDFVYSFDTNHRLTFVNQALLSLWGLSHSEAIGKNFSELGYPTSLVELHDAQLTRAFSGKTIRGENEYRNPDGKHGYYEYIFAPIHAPDGNVTSVVGVTRDITHRKHLEDERQRLLYTIAHDLRSPLSVIATGCHLLELDQDQDVLKAVQMNARRSIRLVEDLLDSSRIRAGESIQLRLKETDLRALCVSTVDEMRILHHNRFELKLPEQQSPCIANIDPDAIQRILANLIANAAKYGRFNSPITLELIDDAPVIRISIQNACEEPIPQEQLSQFFKPFWRASDSNGCSKEPGWGIGLATSIHLAESLGGSITAISGHETGTVFTLSVPSKSN